MYLDICLTEIKICEILASEAVKRRRADNTTTNRKEDKRTMVYKTIYRKLKIEQHEPK